ncbi:MAG: hypothetical protein QM778_03550 [Myxococcales bacterium]
MLQIIKRGPPSAVLAREHEEATRQATRLDHPVERSLNLAFIVGRALSQPRGRVLKSIFGERGSLRTRNTLQNASMGQPVVCEGDLLVPWSRGVKIVARAVLPQWALVLPYFRDDVWTAPPRLGGPDLYPSEAWFFVNGICTNQAVARANAQQLSDLFKRPIRLLYNRTDGLVLDLLECAVGKAFDKVTDGARNCLISLLDALCDPKVKRVVLVSHSQGTILSAVILKTLEEALLKKEGRYSFTMPRRAGKRVSPERRAARKLMKRREQDPALHEALSKLQRDDIGKLELYCFANCATSMEPFVAMTDSHCPPRHAPWIESYGNECDLVAQLGMLSPAHGLGSTRILGDRYERKGAWGHLLNAHYLVPLKKELQTDQGTLLEPFHDNLRTTPRLHEYLDGKSPDSYWMCTPDYKRSPFVERGNVAPLA